MHFGFSMKSRAPYTVGEVRTGTDVYKPIEVAGHTTTDVTITADDVMNDDDNAFVSIVLGWAEIEPLIALLETALSMKERSE
jgi:hypothetical protein